MKRDAVATGRAVMQLLQASQFHGVYELLAPSLRELISADVLRGPWQELLAARGAVIRVGTPLSESAGPNTTAVKILVTCERGAFAVVMAIDDAGDLASLQFTSPEAAESAQPWQPPPYADPATFTEHEVNVGGALATPGTLSVPSGPPRSLPAVVLLAGSGPVDRDVTMGHNKVFKDIAWGLASRGIAVLRFDKVTYTHRHTLDVTDFTAIDEYVRPAVSAIRLLREHPSVDASRVFVLGHSQGGTVAPRIAAAEPAVAGLIVLAGATQPMHHALVRQFRYLAALRNPGADVDADPAVQTIARQVALIDSPAFSPATPTHLLPLGVPAPYWFDLLGYDPVAVAAKLARPMLILQGGRDYQVTVADDLVGWQTGLDRLRDVTIRIYDADDHLFFPGAGPSTPAEYQAAQHVDEAVVTDIAHWCASVGKAP